MYTREEAIDSMLERDATCPTEILQQLALIDVKYLGFDTQIHDGQIVVHQELQEDVTDLFALMLEQKFPLQEVTPIVKYDWDDESSMAANNTTGFNYRLVINTDRISWHGYGKAIDINPKLNPVMDGPTPAEWQVTQPANGSYNTEEPGTLYPGHIIVEFLKNRGWEWGGDWEKFKDYQHFQKVK